MGVMEGSHVFSFNCKNKYSVSTSYVHNTVLGEVNKMVGEVGTALDLTEYTSLLKENSNTYNFLSCTTIF